MSAPGPRYVVRLRTEILGRSYATRYERRTYQVVDLHTGRVVTVTPDCGAAHRRAAIESAEEGGVCLPGKSLAR